MCAIKKGCWNLVYVKVAEIISHRVWEIIQPWLQSIKKQKQNKYQLQLHRLKREGKNGH